MQDSPEFTRPRDIQEQRVRTPSVNIFVGTTPQHAGLEFMRHIQLLSDADQYKVACRFVDTQLKPEDALTKWLQETPNSQSQEPIRITAPTGVEYAPRINQDGAGGETHTFISGHIPQPSVNGAGGIRNNGHAAVIFGVHYNQLRQVVEDAITQVIQIRGPQAEDLPQEIVFNLVNFLGGGTGSGAILDLAGMIHEIMEQRNLAYHIKLYCMFPTGNGTDYNSRKRDSNATASLLELVAISLAASQARATNPNGVYDKRIREAHQYIGKGERDIVNEIFLYGEPYLVDKYSVARAIGLDLYQRATNNSGIGQKETNVRIDMSCLRNHDDRGLPAIFGSSCTLETRLPTHEIADVYARYTAASVLPRLTYYDTGADVRQAYKDAAVEAWNRVATFRDQGGLIDSADRSNPAEFPNATQTQLNVLWSNVVSKRGKVKDAISDQVNASIGAETSQLVAISAYKNIGKAISSLRTKCAQYAAVLASEGFDLTATPPRIVAPIVAPPRPVDKEGILTQTSGATMERAAREVCAIYDAHLDIGRFQDRQELIVKALIQLNAKASQDLARMQQLANRLNASGEFELLKHKALGSNAWKGKLETPHPHQWHVFDRATMWDNGNNPVERLYVYLNDPNGALAEQQPHDQAALAGVNYAALTDEYEQSIEAEGSVSRIPSEFVQRVRGYFFHRYKSQLLRLNLFDIIRVAAPFKAYDEDGTERQLSHLREMLSAMGQRVRPMVTYTAAVWESNAKNVVPALYVGMHWSDVSQQHTLLREAIARTPVLREKSTTPVEEFSSGDPHRLQMAYCEHGYTLSGVPDFYQRDNSRMANYLEFEKRWEINNQSDPPHTCDEMVRLVTDENALPYRDAQGVEHRETLYNRVIRDL